MLGQGLRHTRDGIEYESQGELGRSAVVALGGYAESVLEDTKTNITRSIAATMEDMSMSARATSMTSSLAWRQVAVV